MPSIKVTSISFDQPPFRKLGNIHIDFAERLTVIAGHNGIGKSTIMALVANSSGLTRDARKTLFGKNFQANLFHIVYIDYESEYLAKKEAGNELPEPKVSYLINKSEIVTKLCSITGRQNYKRARVVPRNEDLEDFKSSDGEVEVGRDAKVPLPTIYLGMTRMFPVGEANHLWVKSTTDRDLAPEESRLISEFINSIVVGSSTTSDMMTSLNIRGTGKVSKHPHYSFDSRCVSLGQDSLSTIATALASFQQLHREWADYPGGLLVIDEIDAGLHPHAQRKLIRQIQQQARRLNLQVIATTHSTHVVEAVHPEGQGSARTPDTVVYLTDTGNPSLAADWSLKEILGDMNLEPPELAKSADPGVVKVYFEDAEAAYVFTTLVTGKLKRKLKRELNIKLLPIPLGMGCGSLVGLSRYDKHFERVVIAVDADAPVPGGPRKTAHIVRLPGGTGKGGAGLSPERTLHKFISDLVEKQSNHADEWVELKRMKLTSDQLREHLLSTHGDLSRRDAAKAWWKSKFELIKRYKLIELWARYNAPQVAAFETALEKAVETVAKRIRG